MSTTQPTTRSRYEVLVAESRERFIRDTAKHELTVLHDDGLYRHLRFAQPGTSNYYYSLVTWPGYLAIVGDGPDYVFCRLPDMFEFFTGSRSAGARGEINPSYWAEKLRGPGGCRAARTYSHDALRELVVGWFEDITLHDELSMGDEITLSRALENHSEQSAHEALQNFVITRFDEPDYEGPRRLQDTWEWDLLEYDTWFLWGCWAIVWGIEQYRASAGERATG